MITALTELESFDYMAMSIVSLPHSETYHNGLISFSPSNYIIVTSIHHPPKKIYPPQLLFKGVSVLLQYLVYAWLEEQ